MEEWKTREDIALRSRELDIKKAELAARRDERLRAGWHNPVFIGLLVAALGIGGNAALVLINGAQQRNATKRQE